MLIVELYVNVCETMGANIVNTLCEKIASYLEELILGRVNMRIVTNLNMERRALAQFTVPVKDLGYRGLSGS